MRYFIVINLTRSTKTRPMFWRDNDAGYTTNPFEAGRYSEDHIERNRNYYDDGEETIAVPVSDIDQIGFDWVWDAPAAIRICEKTAQLRKKRRKL